MSNPAQVKFDELYITSTEVMKTMGVSRTSVLYAKRSGLLPEPIVVNDGQLFVWERAALRKYLEAWKLILDVRRGVAA